MFWPAAAAAKGLSGRSPGTNSPNQTMAPAAGPGQPQRARSSSWQQARHQCWRTLVAVAAGSGVDQWDRPAHRSRAWLAAAEPVPGRRRRPAALRWWPPPPLPGRSRRGGCRGRSCSAESSPAGSAEARDGRASRSDSPCVLLPGPVQGLGHADGITASQVECNQGRGPRRITGPVDRGPGDVTQPIQRPARRPLVPGADAVHEGGPGGPLERPGGAEIGPTVRCQRQVKQRRSACAEMIAPRMLGITGGHDVGDPGPGQAAAVAPRNCPAQAAAASARWRSGTAATVAPAAPGRRPAARRAAD